MWGDVVSMKSMKFAAVIAAALLVAGCSSQSAQNGGLNGGVGGAGSAAPGSAQDFVVNVGDRVFFPVDQTDLTAEAKQTLDKQATWLNQYPRYVVTIEGHADERGTTEYNFGLSGRRAVATRDYLVARGIQPTRLSTQSLGKERPVAVCDNESCWSQNRRAVTVLKGGAGS